MLTKLQVLELGSNRIKARIKSTLNTKTLIQHPLLCSQCALFLSRANVLPESLLLMRRRWSTWRV